MKTMKTLACITGIVLPDSVKVIGKGAFCGCQNLAEISIPESVSEIGNDAFTQTAFLSNNRNEQFLIRNGILLYSKAVSGEIVVPDGVTCINPEAFSYNYEDFSVVLPESVSCLKRGAFHSCTPSSITIMNPDCEIYDAALTISYGHAEYVFSFPVFNGVIRGYAGSAAEAYAKKFSRPFEVIGGRSTAAARGSGAGNRRL